MQIETAKLELIERLTKVENEDMLSALLFYKNTHEDGRTDELTDKQKAAIEEGLEDEKAGRLTPSSEVWKKYGR